MIAPARIAAYDILRAVSTDRDDLPAAIARVHETLADERDRALAAEIAIGVQRWRAALDYLIADAAGRPLSKLDDEVLEILRLSVYQLLHLTRVPAAAVVDDAVDLAKRLRKTSAARFVNAILRSISRRRRALPLPAAPDDPDTPEAREAALEYLSVSLSHPRWLAARWLARFGFRDARAWLDFDNAPAPLTLRVNPARASREGVAARLAAEGVDVEPARFAPDGLIVRRGRALQSPAFRDGWFVVQDEASQLVPLLAGASPGTRVLDACASPGGKTTAIAARMGGRGLVVAADVRERRMALLRRTVSASGLPNVRLVQADLLAPLPFSTPFDTVVVDAPCSGLGILRRDPDIRWKRREADLAALAGDQQAMLAHAAAAVAPGGRLVYATCSSEPEENEDVVRAFLEASPDFALLPAAEASPALPAAVIDARGFLRTLPHVHALEAFFGAVLIRRR